MLLMEGAEESLGDCHCFVMIILVLSHLHLHLVGLVELAKLQEVGALFKHNHHLIVIEGKLKIGYSILKGDIVRCNAFFIAFALLRIIFTLIT